jgi:thioredoxin-related protein
MSRHILSRARLWAVVCLFLALPALAAENTPSFQPGHFEIPAWFKNSFLDLPAEIEELGGQGKRLMLMFHQDGCPYCAKLIHDNFSRPEVLEYFQSRFEAIEINVWGDRDLTDFDGEALSEKTFAAKHKVWATPTLLFFDEQGKQILRLDGYYEPARFLVALNYVGEKQETSQSFRAYYAERHPPPSADGELSADEWFAKPPYNLPVDAGDKPVAVFFEEKDCAPCRNLRQEMRNYTETVTALEKFYLVQLDRWADTPLITPDGQKTTAKAWADSLGVSYLPGLVLFADGQQAMRIDAQFEAFHLKNILEYVSSGAFREEPNFQRYLHDRVRN